MNDKEKSFGTEEVRNSIKGFLIAQSSIIHYLFSQHKLDQRTEQIKVLLGSCCQTASAIAKLSDNPGFFLAECIILARAFMEKIINFCYLLVCDSDEFERFIKHTVQKSYRKLNRSMTVGDIKLGVKFTGKIDINSNKLLKESLEEFTSERGREKTHWTTVNLKDRIRIISERSKLNPHGFMMNLLSIYDDASEALHGTLYGCSFHTGAYEPNIDQNNPVEVKLNIEKNITLLLWGLGIAFHQGILLLSEKNDIKEIAEKSTHNFENSFELIEKALEGEKGINRLKNS
jgi:hypothetical protein